MEEARERVKSLWILRGVFYPAGEEVSTILAFHASHVKTNSLSRSKFCQFRPMINLEIGGFFLLLLATGVVFYIT